MQLGVKDILKLFNVSEKTVYRWIKSSDIPFQKIYDQYRFNRVEVLEWATARGISVSPEIFKEEDGQIIPLSAAIENGGIYYQVKGTDKKSVLENVVHFMRLPEEADFNFLLEVLLARESLGTTAIGDGIAIPHPRSPIVLPIPGPVVALCFLESAIDFGALDGKPIHLLFTIFTPTIRSHLYLLSRLSYALKEKSWQDVLAKPGAPEEILESLRAIEQRLQ